jgi:catechol 2,3-dioxygenase-like lactoylglutathione lyase family enzyme
MPWQNDLPLPGFGDARMDMKLEVVVVPVSDVDRAKGFYQLLGWRLDADRWYMVEEQGARPDDGSEGAST